MERPGEIGTKTRTVVQVLVEERNLGYLWEVRGK